MYKKSMYTIRFNTKDGVLILHNTYSGAIATVEKKEDVAIIKNLLVNGLEREPETEFEKQLIENNFLVSSYLNEVEIVDKAREAFKWESKHYELILYPTEECNFRCVYCFEQFLRGEMSKEIQDSVIKHLVKKAPKIDSLNIAWFGGEPVEAVNVVKYINYHAKLLSEKFGFKFTSGITTNAYNLEVGLFKELVALNIDRFQITLDGPKETHDTLRVLKGGGPTFDKIIKNIEDFSKTDLDFYINIRGNFDKTNKDKMEELIEQIHTLTQGDKRFGMYFKPIENYGGTSAKDLPIYDPKESFEAMSEVQKLAHKCFPTTTELLDSLAPFGSTCYAAIPNSIAIGADGTLYKCTLDLHDPINQLGKFNQMAIWN